METSGKELQSFLKINGDYDAKSFAGHLADRISALELNQRTARREGNVKLVDEFGDKVKEIRKEALESGLSKDDYPGLYR